MTTQMTARQVELARHALGLDRNKISYRNYFSVGVGAPDYDQWQQMVRQGNAFRWTGPIKAGTMFGGDDVFHLTRKGANAVLRDGESLDQEDFPQRPRLTMSLSEKIRETTRLMAERAHSPMELWNKHFNACLEAATALEQMALLIDPAVCRLQFPDGSVPGNAKEAAEGWKRWADKFQAESKSLKDCLEKAVRQWKLYADMEEGRDLANEESPEGSLFRLVSHGKYLIYAFGAQDDRS